MVDTRVTALSEDTDPDGTDIIYAVNEPATTPTSVKIQISNLLKKLPGDLDADANVISGQEYGINAQTATEYTLVASDSGKVVTLNNAAAITVTVGSALPAGWYCQIIQKGAGQVTVAAGGTGNVRNRSSHTQLAGQYAVGQLIVESNAGTAPEVYLEGDTA